MCIPTVEAQPFGNCAPPRPIQDAHHGIAQDCHDTRSIAFVDQAAILAQRHILDIVEAVAPVGAATQLYFPKDVQLECALIDVSSIVPYLEPV